MEKRNEQNGCSEGRMERARQVLQRGLSLNPTSACLLQAWGLLELQRGNQLAAVRMLERSAAMDPKNVPVLRWKPVLSARTAVLTSLGATRKMSSASRV